MDVRHPVTQFLYTGRVPARRDDDDVAVSRDFEGRVGTNLGRVEDRTVDDDCVAIAGLCDVLGHGTYRLANEYVQRIQEIQTIEPRQAEESEHDQVVDPVSASTSLTTVLLFALFRLGFPILLPTDPAPPLLSLSD